MTSTTLPLVLAGPILRRVTRERLTLSLAVREPVELRLTLDSSETPSQSYTLQPGASGLRMLTAGTWLHYLLIDLALAERLPLDRWVGYSLALRPLETDDAAWQGWSVWAPDLCYPGVDTPGFMIPTRVGTLLHGSGRKPHFDGSDGLIQADRPLAGGLRADPKARRPQGACSTAAASGWSSSTPRACRGAPASYFPTAAASTLLAARLNLGGPTHEGCADGWHLLGGR